MLLFQVETQQTSVVFTTHPYKWQLNRGQLQPSKLPLSAFQITARKIRMSWTAFCLLWSRPHVTSVSQALETFASFALMTTNHIHQMQHGVVYLITSQRLTTNHLKSIWKKWRNFLEKGSFLLITAASWEVRSQLWSQKVLGWVENLCLSCSHRACPIFCPHWASLETFHTVHYKTSSKDQKQSCPSSWHARIVKEGKRRWWYVGNVAKRITARGNARKRIGRNTRKHARLEESDKEESYFRRFLIFLACTLSQSAFYL